MTLPKKATRTIVVDGVAYLWHRSRRFDLQNRNTAIRKKGTEGQLVLLDPWHHDFSLGAGDVRKAIEFALAHSWTPDVKGKPIKLRYNGDDFQGESFTVLPAGDEL